MPLTLLKPLKQRRDLNELNKNKGEYE